MRMAVKTLVACARLFGAALLLSALACTVARNSVNGEASRSAGGGTSDKKEQTPQIASRALLLFEDANKTAEAQRRARSYDYPSLERKYQAALDADPALAEAEYDLGVLAERQGKVDEAVTHYRSALKRKPSLKEAAINLAVIAQNKGDLPGAMAQYQQILSTHPEDAQSRAHLADIARRGGDHDKAMELARQALMRDPKALLAYKVMMLSYLERKQLAMASLVALRATKIDENDPELYYAMGLILQQENEPVRARAQFKRAVAARPDYVPALIELARMAMKDEDYAGAEGHLRRILQADGNNAEAHVDLGVAYKGMGQYDKALQEYDAAEKLNPNLAALYLNRGIILLRNKDAPEKAHEYFKKYLTLSGDGLVAADHPVVALLKEAEQILQAKAEARRAEEESKKLEAAQKAQQDRLKKEEARESASSPMPGGTSTLRAEQAPAPGAAEKSSSSKTVPARQMAADKKDEPKDDVL